MADMSTMFRGASSFNGDISGWDVSGVADMQDMFTRAVAFDQNLGKWYIVLDDHSIDDGDTGRTVASISAQNNVLGGQSPEYSIASSDDGAAFEIVGSDLKLKSVPDYDVKNSYTVTILSSGGFGTTNSETFDISVEPVILPPIPFVTTWTTATANESIEIPVGGATGQYTVDWDDGNQETVTGDALHQYSDAGTYTVSISGDFTRIYLGGDSANAQKLQSILQWGDIQWSSMNDAFAGASNMVYNATDAPVLSDVNDMSGMFHLASSFDDDISGWDVSGVADMSTMFRGASSFNGDISGWDVSGVTDMGAMFRGASSFNGDISGWDVSGVADMSTMFRGASSFNGDISGWDVSGVADMQDMFTRAVAFDQNLGKWYIVLDDHSIDDGDTGRTVASISAQNNVLGGQSPEYSIASSDDGATFEIVGSDLKLKSVPDYDVKNSYTVTILSSGGFGTTNSETFDISVEPVILPPIPFVTTWTTATANESIEIPVGGATGQYTVDWGDGNQETVTGDALHQYSDAGTYTVSISGDFTRIYLGGDSANAQKLQSIEQWGDIQWSSMNDAFAGASNMVYNATDAPVLSDVNDMSGMFHLASSFDGDISGWDVSGVADMSTMFRGASSFNGDISGWDVSGVTDMSTMFRGASSFNGEISSWNVSGVADMRTMFRGASSFNGDISGWDVSGVTDMSTMFRGASSFNGEISSWNVSGVTDMGAMFPRRLILQRRHLRMGRLGRG